MLVIIVLICTPTLATVMSIWYFVTEKTHLRGSITVQLISCLTGLDLTKQVKLNSNKINKKSALLPLFVIFAKTFRELGKKEASISAEMILSRMLILVAAILCTSSLELEEPKLEKLEQEVDEEGNSVHRYLGQYMIESLDEWSAG